MKSLSLLLFLSLFSSAIFAAMHKDEVAYKHGDTQLKGYVFWDDAFSDERPAVVVFHEWWGLNDYALLRAEMLAESGYVAFAADMYGDSRKTRRAKDAKKWMTQVIGKVDLWQQRANTAFEQLLAHSKVDKTRTAAIGYSFGGSTVMQLAYSGVEIGGVVSVYGSMPVASSEQAKNIKTKVLILHGALDTFIAKDRVQKFTEALSAEQVNWEMDVYGGAKHGFANPYADGYGIDGLEYNEIAEQRSWARTRSFLDGLFSED